MKDEYISAMYSVVKETSNDTGVDLPIDIEQYIVALLASKLDKPYFIKSTFAESYLRIKNHRHAKDLADNCLFITGIFPSYGMNVRYYSDIGKTSYHIVSESTNNELFVTLGTHFDFVRSFLNSIKDKNSFRTNIL